MKKTWLVGLIAVAGGVGVARAYEVPGNPDRKASVGFNYDRIGTNSEYTFLGAKIKDFNKVGQNAFIFDVRLPLTSFLSVSAHGGFLNSRSELFTSEEVKAKGYNAGVGVRLFIP